MSLNQRRAASASRSSSQRYASAMSCCAGNSIMTFQRLIRRRNLLFDAEFIERSPKRFTPAFLHRIQSTLNSTNGIEHLFERGGVLYNQLRLAVHRQNSGAAASFQTFKMGLCVALKIRQRP